VDDGSLEGKKGPLATEKEIVWAIAGIYIRRNKYCRDGL
jgi:hypothetical protein